MSTRRAAWLSLARTAELDGRADHLLEQGFPSETHGRVLRDEGLFPRVDTDGEARSPRRSACSMRLAFAALH